MVSRNASSRRGRPPLVDSTRPKVKRVRPSRKDEILIQPPTGGTERSQPRTKPPIAPTKDRQIYQPPALLNGMKGRNGSNTLYDADSGIPARGKSPKAGFWRSNPKKEKRDDVDVVRRARDDSRDARVRPYERKPPPRSKEVEMGYVNMGSESSEEEDTDYSEDVEAEIDRRNIGSESSESGRPAQDIEYYRNMGTMSSTSELGAASESYESYLSNESPDRPMSPPIRGNYGNQAKKWYQKGIPILSKSESGTVLSGETMLSAPEKQNIARALMGSEDEYLKTKQDLAYCTIVLSSIQLLILIMQLSMCGVAPLDINMMIGPYPDAFSQWGGKNPYKMLIANEWWRMITPAFLHVGVLHLGANVFCQLNAVAMFEREWGWLTWIFIYIISTIGCSAFSNFFDQDTIAVGSSGSLMGLYAAKLAQVVTFSLFETTKVDVDDLIRLDQLSSVLCGLTMVSLLGSFTYIDWSGNMGGLLCGFLAGMVVFSRYLDGCCAKFWWAAIGLLGLGASVGTVMYFFVEEAKPEEDLDDVCEYFRSFYPEGYECGCMWA